MTILQKALNSYLSDPRLKQNFLDCYNALHGPNHLIEKCVHLVLYRNGDYRLIPFSQIGNDECHLFPLPILDQKDHNQVDPMNSNFEPVIAQLREMVVIREAQNRIRQ